jgi:hypothetical protein
MKDEKINNPQALQPKIEKAGDSYHVFGWALALPGGLITVNANNVAVSLRAEGHQGVPAASQEDLKFLKEQGHPFVGKK